MTACTGLWSDSVSSGVEEKCRMEVVSPPLGGGCGDSVACGEKR